MMESTVLSDDGNCPSGSTGHQQRERVATLQLFFSTTLFGISFIGQKVAMTEGIGPLTYTACRFIVSTLLLFLFRPVIQLLIHSEIDVASRTENFESRKVTNELYKWASLCGLAAFGGSNLQQIGLGTVTAGKTAFITGMYVIFVPIVEWALPGFGLQLNWRVWASAAVSMLGMLFLSGDFSMGATVGGVFSTGEIIVFISMLFWVVSIISADVGTKRGVDGVSFTLWEFAVSTILSIILAVIFESKYLIYPFHSILKSWKMILLVGVTEGVSFLFGTLGQMYIAPSRAALIYSLESVTAAVGAYFFLGEILSWKEFFGCFLMLSAAVFCSYESSLDEAIADGDDNSTIFDVEQSGKEESIFTSTKRNIEMSISALLPAGKRIAYSAVNHNDSEVVSATV